MGADIRSPWRPGGFGCSRRQRQLARRSPGSEIYNEFLLCFRADYFPSDRLGYFMGRKTRPGDTVLIEPRVAPVIDDRVAPVIDDRRVSGGGRGDRRIASRLRTLKGAQIVWPTAAPVKCVVRNLSQTGASLEVHGPVPGAFELVFDGDQNGAQALRSQSDPNGCQPSGCGSG